MEERKKIMQIILGAGFFGAGIILKYAVGNVPLSMVFLLSAYVTLGAEVIWQALKNIAKGQIFDENFLMGLATAGALFLGEWAEAAAVMLFYQVGEFFQEAAVRKSRKSIAGLMDIRPDYANLKTDDGFVSVSPDQVNVGDFVIVRPGEKIPLDGVVTAGEGLLDTRSLTGESLPREVRPGEQVLSGCVSMDVLLTIQVTKPFGESTADKILQLVENASQQKAPAERFITQFARYYTPAVVALAVLLAVVPPLFMGGWGEWLHRALIFLVITCPCALVISVPLSYFAGIGAASRTGVLIKGANYLEALNDLDIVVFDKTGTLTRGEFSIMEIKPADGCNAEELLRLAAHAEAFSSHPVGRAVTRAYTEQYQKTVNKTAVVQYEEKAGHGVICQVDGRRVLAGSERLFKAEGFEVPGNEEHGSVVYVSVDGRYAGCLIANDTLRPQAKETVTALRKAGARRVVMLTGDNPEPARRIAEELEIEAYARLLPHEKVEKAEVLDKEKRPGGKLIFIGDGVNDAPVLARADIGVAMGGLGSDAAIEAADLVLMTDEPYKLVSAVRIAQKTRRVVRQNIAFALGVKTIIMVLGALGLANMWAAVFADVGVSLIAIMNALRAMKINRP